MKYIVMADGKGTRWKNYRGIPKHLAEVDGETVLERTVRLLKQNEASAEIIITSHDSRYEVEGAVRYEPLNNVLEIDRFTEELIEDNICFLYGDTCYSEETIRTIISSSTDSMLFFGGSKSIVAIKVVDGELFRKHVAHVRELFLKGEIEKCIGWQVYQSFAGLPFTGKRIDRSFIVVDEDTRDFNTPEEYKKAIDKPEEKDAKN